MSSWWDRHLGAPQTAPTPQRRDSYPPSAPTPQRGVQQPQQTIRNPYRNFGDDQEESFSQDVGIADAVAMGDRYRPKAGKAKSIHDADPEGNTLCPECGSGLYFSRRGAIKRGPAPAPECGNCGYNGLWEQSGTGLSATATPTGPTRIAKQDSISRNGGLDYSHPIHMN